MACKGCGGKRRAAELEAAHRKDIELSKQEYKLEIQPETINLNISNLWGIERHLGSAMQLMYEVRCGYPHRQLAIGNLTRALEKSKQYPELHNEIKNIIIAMRDDKNPTFDSCLNSLESTISAHKYVKYNLANNFTEPRELKEDKKKDTSVITRPSCIECIEKHLGSAFSILNIKPLSYYDYILAVGHLAEAEQEAQEHPQIEDSIYALRMYLQTNERELYNIGLDLDMVNEVLNLVMQAKG